MTYDPRRLRLHGLIKRIPKSHRYDVTPEDLRIALFFTRTYARLLLPKFAQIMPGGPTRRLPSSGTPSIVSRARLTAVARRKNSSPENLTHLHYNFLSKDSRPCAALFLALVAF